MEGKRRKVVIMGAAGRDFHNFNMVFRDDPTHEVVAFTATQIPNIEDRRYPAVLAGSLYEDGIPILSEDDLEAIVKEHEVDECVLAYSDLSYGVVGSISARVHAAGADFRILSPKATMLKSKVPVIAICAVRTGCGKSQTARYVVHALRDAGHRVITIRHPMPYGDLAKQAVQRFATREDLDRHECTFEEREEYEAYVDQGLVIYAGVDYGAILEEAEKEADVIIWDGGNNDWSFIEASENGYICIADPLRAGDESSWFPGEVNFRLADTIIINKVDSATPEAIASIQEAAGQLNPDAMVLLARSALDVDDPAAIAGKRALCVDDGPTLTHGGMATGAGKVAALRFGAAELVDPRPHAVGSIQETLNHFSHLENVLPAMGYFPEQIRDLEETIAGAECDVVVIGTPFDISSKLSIDKPIVVVRYTLDLDADVAEVFNARLLGVVSS